MTASDLPDLVLATANPGKVGELLELLAGQFNVVARPDGLADTIEDGETLEANALKKATEVMRFTGQAALADDTGLFVESLGGAPGVHTARYAGHGSTNADNIEKLLSALQGEIGRHAYFETVLVLVNTDGSSRFAVGRVEGTIAESPSGEQGFGYDSVFIPVEGDGRTFAQMAGPEKQAISHRSRALATLVANLAADGV